MADDLSSFAKVSFTQPCAVLLSFCLWIFQNLRQNILYDHHFFISWGSTWYCSIWLFNKLERICPNWSSFLTCDWVTSWGFTSIWLAYSVRSIVMMNQLSWSPLVVIYILVVNWIKYCILWFQDVFLLKTLKKSTVVLRMVVLVLAMICGVYICTICLKQVGVQTEIGILDIQRTERVCPEPIIEPWEIPYVHYPKPKTYNR